MKKQTNIPTLRFPKFKGEWEKKTLGEVTSKIGDGLHGTPIYSSNTGFYFINGNNLINGVICINENTKEVDYDIFKGNDKSLNDNTILMSINGTIGNLAKYKGEKVMLGKSIAYFNFKENNNFYYFLLQTDKVQNYFIAELTGSTIKNLSLKTLREAELNLPTLPEQQKIASFLSLVDKKITQLNQKKKLLQAYKKGLMQKLFSQELRFKDENGNEFEEWEIKTLGEVAEKKSSNIAANKIENNFGDYIIYGASGVLKKVDFYMEEADYISIVKDGAGVGRLFYCLGKSSVLGTMEIIKPKTGINTYFIYCLLNNIDFVKYVTGSTIPHIYFKNYSNEICGIPCLAEQNKIANFLSILDEKINHCSKEIAINETFKKGLLQQLFC